MSGLEGLLTGQTLVKRYRIEEVIGRGGFAAVYRAHDERLGRPVAVKVITVPAPDAHAAERHRERFEREARAAASLPQHPNVVTVHDFGIDPVLGLDFLVMEFLHGEDLATRLRREGRPPLDEALRILRDAVAGIAVGHRAGIVHRDVKPGNIFLAGGDGAGGLRVCILDFGIARVVAEDHTLTGVPGEGLPLSPAYASPEQTRGARDLTPASDVFSLGVVAYQLLTGEKPFPQSRGHDPAEWVPRRRMREVNPEVPDWLASVVERAMAYAPLDRFTDAEDLGAALAAAADADATLLAPPAAVATPVGHEPPEADRTLYQSPPEPRPQRPAVVFAEPRQPRRRSVLGPLLFLLLLGGGAAGAWWYLAGAEEPVRPDPAAAADLEVVEEGLEEEQVGAEIDVEPRVTGPAPAGPAGSPDPFDPTSALPPFDTLAVDTVGGEGGLPDQPPADTVAVPDSVPADTTPTAPTDPAQRPPPRVLGVPIDSISAPDRDPPAPAPLPSASPASPPD